VDGDESYGTFPLHPFSLSLELHHQLFVLISILPDRFPREGIPFISFIGIFYNISTIYNVTLKVEKIRGGLK
jgi:hypothetical protein